MSEHVDWYKVIKSFTALQLVAFLCALVTLLYWPIQMGYFTNDSEINTHLSNFVMFAKIKFVPLFLPHILVTSLLLSLVLLLGSVLLNRKLQPLFILLFFSVLTVFFFYSFILDTESLDGQFYYVLILFFSINYILAFIQCFVHSILFNCFGYFRKNTSDRYRQINLIIMGISLLILNFYIPLINNFGEVTELELPSQNFNLSVYIFIIIQGVITTIVSSFILDYLKLYDS